eukprot:12901368-Prorocentrum_lima.AAC.1
MKGPRPKDQQTLADPVQPGNFAETHAGVKGVVKGNIAISWMTLLQAGQGKQPGRSERFGRALEYVNS